MSDARTGAKVRHRAWEIDTGVRGYAWDVPRPRGVLLLQHGYGEYAGRYVTAYGALVPRLIELGLSVFAFDLRGHGHSPGRRSASDVDLAVADHLAARRMLAEQPLPVFLMGHSLGGIVTATSVVRDAGNVAGVILSSPVLQVSLNAPTRLLARLVAALVPALPVAHLPIAGLSRLPETLEAARTDPLMRRGGMPARLAASVLFTARANWAHYPRWRVPTLVIHGTADRLTEPDGSLRFNDTIASPDRTLHLVEGGYHELLNDIGGEQTLEVVLAWLRSRLGR